MVMSSSLSVSLDGVFVCLSAGLHKSTEQISTKLGTGQGLRKNSKYRKKYIFTDFPDFPENNT